MALEIEFEGFDRYDQKSGEWVSDNEGVAVATGRRSWLSPKATLTVAALTTAVMAGVGTHVGNVQRMPHVGKLSPAAARVALAHGLSCAITGVRQDSAFYNDGRQEFVDDLRLNMKITETPAYQAAQAQYASSKAVQWQTSLDIETFGPTAVRPAMDYNDSFHILGGNTWSDTAEAPADAADAGAYFGVGLDIVVQAAGKQTTSETPCGAVALRNGEWEVLGGVGIQGSSETISLAAADFPLSHSS